jgi:hypothetical protein
MRIEFFKSVGDFRQWLEQQYATVQELWLGYYKKEAGRPSITWPESVDEALCFGWIDGLQDLGRKVMSAPDQVMVAYHDYRLVALSVVISILAASAASDLVERVCDATATHTAVTSFTVIGASSAFETLIASSERLKFVSVQILIPCL